jgi:hypothetical protein
VSSFQSNILNAGYIDSEMMSISEGVIDESSDSPHLRNKMSNLGLKYFPCIGNAKEEEVAMGLEKMKNFPNTRNKKNDERLHKEIIEEEEKQSVPNALEESEESDQKIGAVNP